jgi:hypothetical protein
MSEPRTKPRWGWWIATSLLICLVAAALRMGLPIHRRNSALATCSQLKFVVVTTSERPKWLSDNDRLGWTAGVDSVDAIFNQNPHYPILGRALELSRSEIDDLLARIRIFSELKRFGVSGPEVNDADLSVLEYFPKLELLDLGSTSITGDGFKYVSRPSKLRKLFLTDTQIDDAGLVYLASLTKLEILHLDRTRISNAGLKHLAKLPNLRELSVSNTAVTDAGLDELLKTHPRLSVSDD